jgi:polyhydroxyalkanoate synthesis regulator phasin
MAENTSKKKPAKKKAKKKDQGIVNDVAELVRTSIFAGLGLAFLGEEKIEEWARKIAKENNLSTRDVKSFVNDLKKQGRDARKDVEKRVKDLIDDIVPEKKKRR